MIEKIKNIIKKSKANEGAISDQLINKHISDPNFPYLVSFPRTGSHWLRIMLEQYSNRPLLTRSFYEHDNDDFLLYHTHDINLDLLREKVIYLHRKPSDVIYSLLNYYKQNPFDKTLVLYWTNQYAIHLSHWIYTEKNTNDKLIITYENLTHNLDTEFKKITDFLNLEWDINKISKIKESTTKETVKSKTKHNQQVVQLNDSYKNSKIEFHNQFDDFITEVFKKNGDLLFGDENYILKLF